MNDAIVSPSPERFAEWRKLYCDYAAFYRSPPPDFDVVWEWLNGGVLRGIAAANDRGALCGIAHWSKIPRPLQAKPLAYLHDLFVAPAARGSGIGERLVRDISRVACAEGCDILRWATAADNARAMRLYDRIATKTAWVIYEQKTG